MSEFATAAALKEGHIFQESLGWCVYGRQTKQLPHARQLLQVIKRQRVIVGGLAGMRRPRGISKGAVHLIGQCGWQKQVEICGLAVPMSGMQHREGTVSNLFKYLCRHRCTCAVKDKATLEIVFVEAGGDVHWTCRHLLLANVM